MRTLLLAIGTALFGLTLALPGNCAEVAFPAREHAAKSSGIVPADKAWSDLAVCYGQGGRQQWEFILPQAGEYYVHTLYASGTARPMRLVINGQPQDGLFLNRATGGFHADSLAWDTWGPFPLVAGRNSLGLETDGYSPHLAGFVVSDSAQQWNKSAFDKLFPGAGVLVPERIAALQTTLAENRAKLRTKLGVDEILFIQRVPYSSTHYYTEYLDSQWTPGGGIFVLSLADGSVRQLAAELTGGIFGRLDLSFDARRIVFDWKRSADEGYRIFEVGLDGTGLRQVLPAPENEAELVEKYRLAYHNGTDDMHPCYLPDGGFAFVSTRCQTSTLCHGGDAFTTTVLYRMDADGGNVRQLSHGALSEATPAILPDGRIMYTRWEYVDKGAVGPKCLWAVRPDGTASAEIYGNDIPFPPTMIQGRPIPGAPNKYLLLGCPHYPQNALGTVIRLDMSQPIRTDQPMTYLTPEVKVLDEGGWHFQDPDHPGQVLVDASGQGPLFRDPFPIDENCCLVAHKPRGFGTRYQRNGYGLYTLDASVGPTPNTDGRAKLEPFYYDPEISCWQPLPVKARRTPPVLRSEFDPKLAEQKLARCIVTDVYRGLEDVERGTIKYLRVLEQIPRPWSARRFGRLAEDQYDQQHAVVSKDGALGLKVQHGVVRVEADGSAHFLVPADANIYFQALDANYLAVQTERTFVNFMPGETRGCIGCHETPADGPGPAGHGLLALAHEPALPGPQPGEASGRRPLHYPSDVQPVWDRHCVECHNEKRTDGGLDLTGRLTRLFSVSYESLLPERRGARQDRIDPDLVSMIGENHPKTGNVRYLPPRSLGSHNSLLIAMLAPQAVHLAGDAARLARLERLVQAHRDVHLAPDELLRISTWVDTNAQYYGSYFGRRNLKDRDHPDFRPVPTWESALGIPPAAVAAQGETSSELGQASGGPRPGLEREVGSR